MRFCPAAVVSGGPGVPDRPVVLGLFDWRPPTGESLVLDNPPFPLPYRADLLPQWSGLDLHVVAPATGRVHRKLRDVVEHRSGVRMDLLVRGTQAARHADAVLAFLEHHLGGLSWARRHRMPPYARIPAVGISCWWAEELVAGTVDPATVARVATGIDRLLVFSENQREIFASAGIDPERVRPVHFGADHRYFTPVGSEPRFDVLAVGMDRGRDWPTLLAAARRLPQVRFDIVTTRDRIADEDVPSNVTVHPPVDFSTYRDMLRCARLVVAPSIDLAYPTGQSVLLEAMACGRCVVVTATEVMADYLGEGRWNLGVPPGDPGAMAAVITGALEDDALRDRIGRGGRSAVEQHFTFEGMWERIGQEISGLL